MVIVALWLFSFHFAWAKVSIPYEWWYVNQSSIWEANSRIEVAPDIYGGFSLGADSKNLFETSQKLVEKTLQANDEIFAFPNIPIFYLMANRSPPTKAVVHWFDFFPDALASSEVSAIAQLKFRMIFLLRLPEEAWTVHERLFCVGRSSGQRDILRTIEDMISKDKNFYLARIFQSMETRYILKFG